MEVYVLLKILKLCVPSIPKVASYDAKLSVRMALNNKYPSKEEIGKSIGECLMYENLKDKFVGIKDELAELGFGRIEVLYIHFTLQESIPLIFVNFQVLDNALRFVKKDDMSQEVLR